MAFDTNWDLNKYRYHYELPHHWDLKKKFILFHKERFPEDRLVCLAQIFCNVHYLGCRYGEEVMELIDELTRGLTERNEKFDSKSFALASDAVEAKVKAFTGQNQPQTQTVRRTTEPIAFVRASEPDRGNASASQDVVDLTDSPPTRKRTGDNSVNGNHAKSSRFYYDENPSQNQQSYQQRQENQPFNQQRHQNQSFNQQRQQNQPYNQPQYSVQFSQQPNEQYRQQFGAPQNQRFYQQGNQARENQSVPPQNKTYSFEARRATALVREVVDSGPFGKVVVFKNSQHDDGVINIIERAASAAHMITSYTYNQQAGRDGSYSCKFCLDGMYVADGEGKSQRLAKEAACKLALERLRETSFTIEVKERFVGGENVPVSRDLEANSGGQGKVGLDVPLAESNIGSKMLKMMGWTGGGLGKQEQGIEEPIKPYDQNIKRGGLGITNFSDFRRKVSQIIQDYAHSDDKNDLVFSPDFSKDERKTIHELVRKYNLKSRSFGKNEENRHIVIFRKISPLEIVEELLACGGETQKYKLISPEPKIK